MSNIMLYKTPERCSFFGFPTWGCKVKITINKRFSSDNGSAGTLVLEFPASKTMRNDNLLFNPDDGIFVKVAHND
jgi:hypothetical protein